MALPQSIRFDSLLSAAKSYLTPDVVRNASVMTGESESATRQAMHGGIASVFTGLTNMASTSEGASTLGSLSREPALGRLLNNVSSSFSGIESSSLMNSGQTLMGKIFGDHTTGVSDLVARSSGISSSSSGKLMAMLAPLTLGVLGKYAAAHGLNATGLANSLTQQKDEFAAAAPTGLFKLLGDRAPAPVGMRVAPDTDAFRDTPRYQAPVGATRALEKRPGGFSPPGLSSYVSGYGLRPFRKPRSATINLVHAAHAAARAAGRRRVLPLLGDLGDEGLGREQQ